MTLDRVKTISWAQFPSSTDHIIDRCKYWVASSNVQWTCHVLKASFLNLHSVATLALGFAGDGGSRAVEGGGLARVSPSPLFVIF